MGKNLLNEIIISLALTTLLLAPVISMVLATYDYDDDYQGDFWYGLDSHVWGYYSGSYYMTTQHKAERFGSILVGFVGNMYYLFWATRHPSYSTGEQQTSQNSISAVYDERWGQGTEAGTYSRQTFYKILGGDQWTKESTGYVNIY